MVEYTLTPSKTSSILNAENIHDFSKGVLNAQPDLVANDDRDWVHTPSNYDILYSSGNTDSEFARNLRASSLIHDTTNEMIVQGYRNGISNNSEGLKRIFDLVVAGEHPTQTYLNMKSRELQDQHGLEPEDIQELQLWGRQVEDVTEDISANLPAVKHQLNGDSLRPESESFNTSEHGGVEFRTMADLKFSDYDSSEIAETKLKWSENPDVPQEQDVIQARLTASVHGSRKAYLVYPTEGKVEQYAPFTDGELDRIIENIAPALEEVNEVAGWDEETDEVSEEVAGLLRDSVEDVLSEHYRDIKGLDMDFDGRQTELTAYQ